MDYTKEELILLSQLLDDRSRTVTDRFVGTILSCIAGLFMTEKGGLVQAMQIAQRKYTNKETPLKSSHYLSPQAVKKMVHERSRQSIARHRDSILIRGAPRISKLRDVLYRTPLKKTPLYIADPIFSEIVAWRLQIHK